MQLFRLFLASAGRLLRAGLVGLWPGAGGLARWSGWRRILVMPPFVLVFGLVQLIHWIGFLLDEILFPGYRRVVIEEPLFVLGVPRSGTTHLHRVLAEDPGRTTFSTWECLFALSVTERRFWQLLARLDRAVGAPLARALALIEQRAFGAMEAVHPMRLADPEEDYFALMPVLAAFILVLPFPTDVTLWRVGTFDRDMPEAQKRALLAFYRGCLQRHIYCHGPDQRLLSKNAAFAPLAMGLRETFPDARFVVCLRDPASTLPSQLSSVDPGARFFGVYDLVPDFQQRLARQLAFYYRNLEHALGDLPRERCAWVTMRDLKDDLAATVHRVYDHLGLPFAAEFEQRLMELAEQSRRYKSGHRYRIDAFDLPPGILDDLAGHYAALASRSVMAAPPVAQAGAPNGPSSTLATESVSSC